MTEPKTKTVSQKTKADALNAALHNVKYLLRQNETTREYVLGYIRGVEDMVDRLAPR